MASWLRARACQIMKTAQAEWWTRPVAVNFLCTANLLFGPQASNETKPKSDRNHD